MADDEDTESLYKDFAVDALLDKQMVMLSSGELRRLQIVKALLLNPRVLIMDNPYIGLDADTRGQLTRLLKRLIEERGLQLILVVSREEDIPDFVTHVVPVNNRTIGGKIERRHLTEKYLSELCETSTQLGRLPQNVDNSILYSNSVDESSLIALHDVTLRYGSHTIFEHLSWDVKRGERWALHGRNGSGKSALLGLICADNPQSYACNISLFGCRRGTGRVFGISSAALDMCHLRCIVPI